MALRTFSKEKTAFHRDTAMPIRTSIKEKDISFNSVIVTQDFLRIEDGKKDIFETPFKKTANGCIILQALRSSHLWII